MVLHYLYDPLCGWCYAAESMIEAASRNAPGKYAIKLHAGGLFSRTHLPDAKRSYIRVADARIGELTGQVFGEAYLNGLLSEPNTIYDSAMPIRGILAAEAVKPGNDLPMLKALQRAHYRSGLRIVELPTIVQVAETIGLDAVTFTAAFERVGEAELTRHLGHTHRMMQEIGARGYPTFVVQTGKHFEVLPHDRFYGDAEGFAERLSSIFSPRDTTPDPTQETTQAAPRGFGRCTGDSCEL